jgi:hypothetical protein
MENLPAQLRTSAKADKAFNSHPEMDALPPPHRKEWLLRE